MFQSRRDRSLIPEICRGACQGPIRGLVLEWCAVETTVALVANKRLSAAHLSQVARKETGALTVEVTPTTLSIELD